MEPRDLLKRVVLLALGVAFVAVLGPRAGASDSSTAKKLVITKADVGRGFVAEKAGDNSDAFALIAACVGTPVDDRKVVATARGPELINDTQHSDINSSADIVKTKAIAQRDRSIVADPKFPDCLGQVAEDQGGGASGGITSVQAQRANVKRFGDYSTAVLAQIKGTRNGQPVTISAIEVFVQKGRAELGAEFITNGTTPFDRVAAEKIIAKVAKRLDQAKVSSAR